VNENAAGPLAPPRVVELRDGWWIVEKVITHAFSVHFGGCEEGSHPQHL
jgi:hypothetical protein